MKLTPYLVVAVILGGIETDTPLNKFAHWRRLKTALTDFFAFQVFYQGPKSPEASFLGQEKVEAIHQTMYWWMDWHPSPQALPLSFAILALDTSDSYYDFRQSPCNEISTDPLFLSFICPRLRPPPRKSWSWKPPPPSSQVALATIRVSRAATATTILAREATTIQPLD